METQNILTQFYEGILGIPHTWKVVKVEKDTAAKEVKVSLEYAAETHICPICGKPAKLYDHWIRRLRHLDTCDYKTILEVAVPRVQCPEHHVEQLELEVAEKHSWYTGMFEMLVLVWLQDEAVSTVARSWT
jgi:transposase